MDTIAKGFGNSVHEPIKQLVKGCGIRSAGRILKSVCCDYNSEYTGGAAQITTTAMIAKGKYFKKSKVSIHKIPVGQYLFQ